jgi:hypothetical protein
MPAPERHDLGGKIVIGRGVLSAWRAGYGQGLRDAAGRVAIDG